MRVSPGSGRGAFTLVELLVTIAVISILVILLMPALSRGMALARSTACRNHLHQMGVALQSYVDEHQKRYPYYHGLRDPGISSTQGAPDNAYWWARLQPYYPLAWTNPAYHCPAYKGPIRAGKVLSYVPLGSYAYNAKGVGRATNEPTLGLGGWARPGRKTVTMSQDQIKMPSEMFAIGESRWKDEGTQLGIGGVDYMQCGLIGLDKGQWAFDPRRHGKSYNQLCCDGHVMAINPWALFNPTNTAILWNYDHQPHPELWPGW